MDDQHGYRGWDVWLQEGRIGFHHIHNWPNDALKVVAKSKLPADSWTHVTIVYDGTMRASGARIYYDGVAQEVTVEADALKNTTRTTVPLKLGQREATSRVQNIVLSDLRIYERTLDVQEIAHVARSARTAELLAKSNRAEQESKELLESWLREHDEVYRQSLAHLDKLHGEIQSLQARGTIAHDMQ
jgi:hypothetical protein